MLLSIFTVWLGLFSICFTFLPFMMVWEWKKRGTADGFSSVNFVLPVLIQCCWLRHGLMTNDQTNIIINSLNLVFFAFYISAFAYYQPKRKYLIGQLIALVITVKAIFAYVDMQAPSEQADTMGTAAAAAQIASLAGGLYEIKRAVSMGTTEYIPASFQFALFTLIVQWLLFGILHGNQFIAIANAAGLVVNILTLATYFFYPPLTWTVPIFNIPPQKISDKKI
ncbi:unnamed protein product [Caenorhabditis auriculariae]|uniref:Sugar transporter SWEET n=1 Tax=Caenorhabditis auriculariae TaxID=2777116 RepID=A0A8S1HY14_9PELO|nr:unnamed protein product [Caenorhabditis auriculariae]